MGYAKGVKGYRLWCLEDSKFIISRDVTFDENSMVALSKAMLPVNGVETKKTQVVEIEESEGQPGSSRVQEGSHGDTQQEDDDELEHEEVQQENVQALQQQQPVESLAGRVFGYH